MQQMWMRAQKVYQSLKDNPPHNVEEVCRCANDVEANGVLSMLTLVADSLRDYGDEIPEYLLEQARLGNLESTHEGGNMFEYDFKNYPQQKELDQSFGSPKYFEYDNSYKKDHLEEKGFGSAKYFEYDNSYRKDKLMAKEAKKDQPADKNFGYDLNSYKKDQPADKNFNYDFNYLREQAEKKDQPADKNFGYDLNSYKKEQQADKNFGYDLNSYKKGNLLTQDTKKALSADKNFGYDLNSYKKAEEKPHHEMGHHDNTRKNLPCCRILSYKFAIHISPLLHLVTTNF